MADVSQKVPYALGAEDGQSPPQPIDLAKFPKALAQIAWAVNDPNLAAVNTTTDDLLNAVVVPADGQAGPFSVNVTVTAVNVVGEKLTATVTVSFDPATPVAKALSLTAGDALLK